MTAWSVPTGVAKLAPLTAADELLHTWCEIVRLRLEATLLERGDAGLVQGDEPADVRRERAARIASLMERRLSSTSTPPALVIATMRLGVSDPLASVAILVASELDPAVAALARRAGDAAAGPYEGSLRVAGVAAARPDRSPALALDAIAQLVTRDLASLGETDEPAMWWPVRGHRRWLPLAAGRLAAADDLAVRELATADRWLADAGGRRRAIRVLGEIPVRTLIREATLLDACLVFAIPAAAGVIAALTAARIPVIVDETDG